MLGLVTRQQQPERKHFVSILWGRYLLCLAARAVAADTPAKGGNPQAPAGFQ
jgi:outer membrane immunogenic protein